MAKYIFRFFAGSVYAISAVLCLITTVPAQEPLKLGVHPYLAPSEIISRFTPLADYLSRELKRPVVIELSHSYDVHMQKIANNMVDIAFMGPAPYVLMTDNYGKKPLLAAFESSGKKTFRGVIITRNDSGITSLSQLKGKKFAFGDSDSTMSHLVPRYMLLKSGISVKDLVSYQHLANHDNIALSVLAGSFDAGAVKNEVFIAYKQEGLRAIAVTPEINDHLFVASSLLPKRLIQTIRGALLGLKDRKDGKKILSTIRPDLTALVDVDDREYDNLRHILRELKRSGVNL